MLRKREILGRFLIAMFAISMAGCGIRAPTSGVEFGLTASHSKILVVSLLTDDLRVIWSDGWKSIDDTRTDIGWGVSNVASEIAAELLKAHGAHGVHIEHEYYGDATGEALDKRSREVWKILRSDVDAHNADAILVIEQNAVNALGRQYSPAVDFFTSGLIGLASGAAMKDKRFSPAVTLAIMVEANRTMLGPSRCSVGFDARLIDARTGDFVGRADLVLGQEFLPDNGVKAKSWSEMTPDEQTLARNYCFAALRRGISQTLVELGLLR